VNPSTPLDNKQVGLRGVISPVITQQAKKCTYRSNHQCVVGWVSPFPSIFMTIMDTSGIKVVSKMQKDYDALKPSFFFKILLLKLVQAPSK